MKQESKIPYESFFQIFVALLFYFFIYFFTVSVAADGKMMIS